MPDDKIETGKWITNDIEKSGGRRFTNLLLYSYPGEAPQYHS